MNSRTLRKNLSTSNGMRMHQGCGNIGRSKLPQQQRCSLSSLHRNAASRPQSRNAKALPGGWNSCQTYSRPGSAKHWAERCWMKQEEQELRKQEWEETNNKLRTAQFRADFFNSKPSAPR